MTAIATPANMVANDNYNRQLAIWLLICAVTIYGMIVLGGVTRLTESGLSIVEWQPLMGAIPPTSEADWQETFDKYKQFPQYQKQNQDMTLDGFKRIFYYEYFHRLLGRLIGVLFFIPFVVFYFQKKISKPLLPKLIGLFVLGGLQGGLGWFMVKSGLVDSGLAGVSRVSQYRLTAHLGLAVIIYGYMMWLVFGLLDNKDSRAIAINPATISNGLKRFALTISALLFLMILSGGLVSGIRAGVGYNTFPLMNGYFFPPGLYGLEPAWTSMFEQNVTVQFNHRMFAYLMFILISCFAGFALYRRVQGAMRIGVYLLLVMLFIQVGLGITTLLLVVPVPLAAAHQGGAILLLTASLFVSYQALRSKQ